MKLSVVIPAHNEEDCIGSTLRALYQILSESKISHEILVVNDHSTDGTHWLLLGLQKNIHTLRILSNESFQGYGMAVRLGLDNYHGDAVAVFMADGSDDPGDLLKFFQVLIERNVDCVFGSRFIRGGKANGYPPLKLVLNRFANWFIQLLFGLAYNDVTNAFKLYRREVIDGLRPFLSWHFNLTVELPLKALVRGYSYEVVPNSWLNRKSGISKFKIREMGSRYLFIILYCFIEKWLSRGDYTRPPVSNETLLKNRKPAEYR